MKKLTPRLQAIYEEINIGQSVADIGTDHGYLPIKLISSGRSDKVILTDISAPSLEKARLNAGAEGVEDKLEFRLGDGFVSVGREETDVAVIAGMGGELMAAIIEKDPIKSRSFKKIVLQPRTRTGALRARLAAAGFDIAKECLVREGEKICPIIIAIPQIYEGHEKDAAEKAAASYAKPFPMSNGIISEKFMDKHIFESGDPIVWEIPLCEECRDRLKKEYLAHLLIREEMILRGLSEKREAGAEEYPEHEVRIEILKGILRTACDREDI